MPSPSTTDLPIPKSWDEFEDICADLLRFIWRDPYVTRNGRSGQKQNGVDIYGKPEHLKGGGSELAAAQCKRVETLTESQIETEINEAAQFIPIPEEYLILTTLKRDAAIQKYLRNNSWKIKRVEILFWEDISLKISGSDELLKKHYPRWFQTHTSKTDLIELLERAVPEEFEYNDSIGQFLYKRDVSLRLQFNRPDTDPEFNEDWVTKFPNKRAYQQEVYLEYNGIRIETFWFVNVDGGRYFIPYPKSADDLRISRFQYHLALILNKISNNLGIDWALKHAGIVVDPGL